VAPDARACDQEVALHLAVSVATVNKHVQNAIAKLGARNRLHAVVVAARKGGDRPRYPGASP
jgi:DNA-binding CsgD family transcriptional regulator